MSERRCVIKNGTMDIRKFCRPPRPKTASSRAEQAEEQATAEQEHFIPAEKEQAASSYTEAQAPPLELEREQVDYSTKPSDNDRCPLPSPGPRCSRLSKTQDHGGPPDDLGEDKPAQVILNKFPSRLFKGQKRSFVALWYNRRDWLEYSVKSDAAFCLMKRFNSGRHRLQLY
ncbi:hypothetical protein ABVT39_016206 [Epinephelus coioides]